MKCYLFSTDMDSISKNRKINKKKSFYEKGGQIRLDIRHTWSILPNFELSALSSDFTHNASFLSPFRIIERTSEIIVVARNNNRSILILDQVCKRALGK